MEIVLEESQWKMGTIQTVSKRDYLSKILKVIDQDSYGCFKG